MSIERPIKAGDYLRLVNHLHGAQITQKVRVTRVSEKFLYVKFPGMTTGRISRKNPPPRWTEEDQHQLEKKAHATRIQKCAAFCADRIFKKYLELEDVQLQQIEELLEAAARSIAGMPRSEKKPLPSKRG